MDTTYIIESRVASLEVVARGIKVEVCFSTVAKVAHIESHLQVELNAILFGL